jgi:hypothetical protein
MDNTQLMISYLHHHPTILNATAPPHPATRHPINGIPPPSPPPPPLFHRHRCRHPSGIIIQPQLCHHLSAKNPLPSNISCHYLPNFEKYIKHVMNVKIF